MYICCALKKDGNVKAKNAIANKIRFINREKI